MSKVAQPDALLRVWTSAREVMEMGEWIPEVVGTPEEIIHLGTIKVIKLQMEVEEILPVPEPSVVEVNPAEASQTRFIDADPTPYLRIRDRFRIFNRRRKGR